jgi:hypothetical protein
MFSFPKSVPLSLLGCTWLISLSPVAAHAQLSISLDDDVVLQDGNKPPLVVKPGQSFGGTLTTSGFQGVMTGPKGTQMVTPAMPLANPFRDPVGARPQSLKINAGDVSLTVPMAAPQPDMTVKPMLPRQKLQAVRTMARTKVPAAMPQVDKLMRVHAPDPDLLQLKALLLMQAGQHREAAAMVYDAMAMDAKACWTWPMLRSSVPDQDAATVLYRLLKQHQREQPSLEHDFLMAWWERMLDHRPEALAMLQRAVKARPKDAVFAKMLDVWSESADDLPPAVMP